MCREGPIRDSELSGNAPSPNPLPARGETGPPGITRCERAQQILAVAAYSPFTGAW